MRQRKRIYLTLLTCQSRKELPKIFDQGAKLNQKVMMMTPKKTPHLLRLLELVNLETTRSHPPVRPMKIRP
tara:strand:- start:249 stop:461 length:213 start_codon:yes stop_codon:yes gene_type:complete